MLSARDAVEKARLDIDLAGSTVADLRVTMPLRNRSIVLRSAAAEGAPVTGSRHGSKQHKINDWLPCPGVVLPGLVGCLDPA